MDMRRSISVVAAGAVLTGGLLGGVALGAGAASAAPKISCVGEICKNRGDQWGIGHGQYRCPNGIVYPSIAIVPPRGTAAVFPARCNPAPNLYF